MKITVGYGQLTDTSATRAYWIQGQNKEGKWKLMTFHIMTRPEDGSQYITECRANPILVDNLDKLTDIHEEEI